MRGGEGRRWERMRGEKEGGIGKKRMEKEGRRGNEGGLGSKVG